MSEMHPSAGRRAELIWEGKYDADGKRVAPLRVQLPVQTVEMVNESAQERQKALSLPFVVPICTHARRYGDTPTRRFVAAARDPRVRLPHRRISPHSAGGACFSYPKIPAVGYLANKPISTTVDSQLAKYYLEASSTHSFPNANANERIADVERRFEGRALDWLTLKEISEETSPDFATTFFINHSLSDRHNQRFQAGFSSELQRIKSLIYQRRWARIVQTALQRYKLLFIPGFHYLSDNTSGADFSNQRQLMHQLGLDVQLAATEEDGTVEENAKMIARIVRAESRSHSKLILVSTSKGGPETALALGKNLKPGETTSVKAWLSVGGLIRGTFLADRIMAWPKSWIARIIFWHEKVDFRSLPGLTTAASRARMNGINLPRHILVVQYVATPLSGDIADDVRSRYTYLRKYGPNDGLTLLADELVPDGITIIEPGIDHFYRDPEINLKSLAIANLVAEELTVGSNVPK